MRAMLGQEPPIQRRSTDGCPSSGLRHVPSHELATCSTAKDENFKLFNLRQGFLRVCAYPGIEAVYVDGKDRRWEPEGAIHLSLFKA